MTEENYCKLYRHTNIFRTSSNATKNKNTINKMENNNASSPKIEKRKRRRPKKNVEQFTVPPS